jgi:hypothetical protein
MSNIIYLAIIIIFVGISLLSSLYFNMYVDNVVLRSYYSIQYELYNVYKNDVNYYEIFYNVCFVLIVIIISTVLYWDTVYKNAKKTSKCHEISKIIEENTSNKYPFLHTIIIFNNDKIDKSISKYFLKIIYDFEKMKTTIDYGNDNGKDDNLIDNYPKNKDNVYCDTLLTEFNKISDNPPLSLYKKNLVYENFYYFDLRELKSNHIVGINTKVLNSDKYKYLTIGPDNKVIKNYSSNALLKFTKEYSMNEKYNTSIIYDILFAKKNKDKLSL